MEIKDSALCGLIIIFMAQLRLGELMAWLSLVPDIGAGQPLACVIRNLYCQIARILPARLSPTS
jgi:hypothetical protein